MGHEHEIEVWLRRAEVYRRRGMPLETRQAIHVATRIMHTVDLAQGAIQGATQVHREANAAVQRNPGAEAVIRDIEATVHMVLPVIVARYALGSGYYE